MNKKFKMVMNSVDDAILEEAFVPMKKKKSYRGIAVGLAACMVLVLGLTLTLRNDYKVEQGQDDAGFSASAMEEIYALADSEETMVSFAVGKTEYACEAVKTSECRALTAEGEVLSWNCGEVALQLSSSSSGTSVSWYIPGEEKQWYLSAQASAEEVLTTASQILSAIGLNVAVAPQDAENVTYNAFPSNGLTVVETTFVLNGITYAYRMAGTYEIAENFADISGMEGVFAENGESNVRWCNARLSFNDGAQGKIVWFDVAPGILYSLSMESGASTQALENMANTLFVPAQDDVG